MARVSTYLNFARETEAALNFYRQIFGTEFNGPIARFADPPDARAPRRARVRARPGPGV